MQIKNELLSTPVKGIYDVIVSGDGPAGMAAAYCVKSGKLPHEAQWKDIT